MDIVTVPNKILTTPTKPVVKFDDHLRKIVREMEEILNKQRDPEGVGLSANQVGLDLRLAIVRLNPENLLAIVNPRIVHQSPIEDREYEGCLSIHDQYGMVERSRAVTIQFQDLKGEKITLKATGFLARIFQHEIDHLDGHLITERSAKPLLTEEELEKILMK